MDKPPVNTVTQIDRQRISELAELIRTNNMVRRYLEGKNVFAFPMDVITFEDYINRSLELIYQHLPDAIKRVNELEITYQTWFEKVQLYDKLAKEVRKLNNKPEQVTKLLNQLGYKE